MGEKEKDDLFYVCSLIEYVGRRTKNRRGDVVAAMDDACLKHHLEYIGGYALSFFREHNATLIAGSFRCL